MSRAVFIDKDGTLVPDIPFNADPERITLVPGALLMLRALRAAGYRIMLVSNQPGVALKMFTLASLDQVSDRMVQLTEGMIEACYYCPHHAADACTCRKPAPGLLLQAAREHDLSMEGSWMIGDILNDVEAGNRAGALSILVDNGGETEWLGHRNRIPFAIVPGLEQVAGIILSRSYHS